ncbi:hypothetical protein L1987_35529 [Smallanthus sonchifolius]|uniref:Uncharacterized protein n=1 Tax=Smallanthus sonchifolius TaxID=185202 RepID=A0ACB9HXM9_9ASTR|nr:hypothetical protein L1987_35529 [Smallanthus sonchifolius]
MGDTNAAATTQNKPLHPAYTVTDIQRKIRILDGVKVSYSSWVKLFKLHAQGYKVMHHIDGTKAPAKTDPEYASWSEIDAIVLQWIYGTLSDDLLVRVLDSDSTAFDAWSKIKSIFLNNKGARAAALEHEFTNLTLKSMPSLEAYCQKLKDLGDQLNDVDCPVNEQRLVLQLVRGLPTEFDVAGAYINQSLPTWETACSMLQLEHQRQTARESLSTPTALVVVSDEQPRPENFNRRRGSGSRPNQSRRPHQPSNGPNRSRPPYQQQAQSQSTHWPTSAPVKEWGQT